MDQTLHPGAFYQSRGDCTPKSAVRTPLNSFSQASFYIDNQYLRQQVSSFNMPASYNHLMNTPVFESPLSQANRLSSGTTWQTQDDEPQSFVHQDERYFYPATDTRRTWYPQSTYPPSPRQFLLPATEYDESSALHCEQAPRPEFGIYCVSAVQENVGRGPAHSDSTSPGVRQPAIGDTPLLSQPDPLILRGNNKRGISQDSIVLPQQYLASQQEESPRPVSSHRSLSTTHSLFYQETTSSPARSSTVCSDEVTARSKRRRSSGSPSQLTDPRIYEFELSETERLLVELREKNSKKLPWSEIVDIVNERTSSRTSAACLQMRYMRLKERFRVWTVEEEKALVRVKTKNLGEGWEKIAKELSSEVKCKKWSPGAVAKKWAQLNPGEDDLFDDEEEDDDDDDDDDEEDERMVVKVEEKPFAASCNVSTNLVNNQRRFQTLPHVKAGVPAVKLEAKDEGRPKHSRKSSASTHPRRSSKRSSRESEKAQKAIQRRQQANFQNPVWDSRG